MDDSTYRAITAVVSTTGNIGTGAVDRLDMVVAVSPLAVEEHCKKHNLVFDAERFEETDAIIRTIVTNLAGGYALKFNKDYSGIVAVTSDYMSVSNASGLRANRTSTITMDNGTRIWILTRTRKDIGS